MKVIEADKLNAAEQASEDQRKADLAGDIERKDDVELKLFAVQLGVPDADKIAKRADLVAAIELKTEADAAAGRKALRAMEAEEAASVAAENDKRPPSSRVIRALNAEFCRDVPQEGRAGSFEPDDGHPRFGGGYDVPDGKYRVTGSDWVFEIRKKKLAAAVMATEANRYGGKGVIAVD